MLQCCSHNTRALKTLSKALIMERSYHECMDEFKTCKANRTAVKLFHDPEELSEGVVAEQQRMTRLCLWCKRLIAW